MRNRVLVVGHESSHALHLIQDVTGLLEPKDWLIDNKYYSASVDFVFCTEEAQDNTLEGPWHGVILVFDPSSRHESALGPHFWDRRWSSFCAEEACLRVMVSHSTSPDECLEDGRRRAWRDWSLDKGLEFVECDMENGPGEREGASSRSLLSGTYDDDDDDDDDEEGHDHHGGGSVRGKKRLLEALATTDWPHMTRKTMEQQQQYAAAEEEKRKVKEKATQEKKGDADDEGGKKKGVGVEYLLEHDMDDGTLEGADPFEHALQQAREMRQHALNLPDEQRREFASKMALHLLSLMEGFGEEDDDDDDEMEPNVDVEK